MVRVVAILLALLPLRATADMTDRLAVVGRVWGMVKFAHPALGYRDIDWDAAGARAVIRVLGGNSAADTVAEMLAALDDPMTRVERDCQSTSEVVEPTRWLDDGTLFLSPFDSSVDGPAALRQARRVIVDLRTPLCTPPPFPDAMQRLLILAPANLLSMRRMSLYGYRSQIDPSLYSADFAVTGGAVVQPDPAASAEHVVFIVNARSNVPPLALALQRAGRAVILSIGAPLEDPFVSHADLPLDAGWHAVIRTAELLPAGGLPSTAAIASLPEATAPTKIVQVARSLLTQSFRRRAVAPNSSRAPLPSYRWHTDETYPEMTYPAVEYRVLAAYRLWNIIQFFYGYPQLIDPWEPRLGPMIQMMIEARNADEYGLAMGTWMTWIPDAHSFVQAPPLHSLRGEAEPPFQVIPIVGNFVVNRVFDTTKGVKTGDVLTAIDGRPVSERVDELAKYTFCATDEATRFWIAMYLPRGAIGSSSEFTFRRPAGTTYTAVLARSPADFFNPGPAPAKAWKALAGNIGYVDLNFLMPADVSRMFSELGGTRGIIFDMRGYPNQVFITLGRAMNLTGSSIIAQIRVPRITGGVRAEDFLAQDIGKAQLLYSKKTVMLIDGRAVSQAEHTCLTLEAVNGTTFVGSPTDGSNGNVTVFVLPGKVYGQFTGMDVRHADGRQLQRVGILPDIEVRPTIDGLSQGRDEVLDRALAFLTH